jgi:hypothetical protein
MPEMDEIPELTTEQLERAMPASQRQRLMRGDFRSGQDIADLRHFLGLTQAQLEDAIEVAPVREVHPTPGG